MSAADMQLVRIVEPGGINIAVGEPYFLHDVFGSFYPRYFEGSATYPPLGGDPELIDLAKKLTGAKHVVITNGAKQALLAATWALQYTTVKPTGSSGSALRRLYHPAPYWPTYPTIAELSHLTFRSVDNPSDGRMVRIITSPNNPDGSITETGKWDIWDAAYASRVYGFGDGASVPEHRMSVWSAAKLFGPSGYRVGWVATNEERLAEFAAQYVEKTTSGVARPSQFFVRQMMRNLDAITAEQGYELVRKAQALLTRSSDALWDLSKHFDSIGGYPTLHQGMFTWVRAKDPERFKDLLVKSKVRVVGGQFCGATDDWFRISLGVLPEVMQTAVKAIQAQE